MIVKLSLFVIFPRVKDLYDVIPLWDNKFLFFIFLGNYIKWFAMCTLLYVSYPPWPLQATTKTRQRKFPSYLYSLFSSSLPFSSRFLYPAKPPFLLLLLLNLSIKFFNSKTDPTRRNPPVSGHVTSPTANGSMTRTQDSNPDTMARVKRYSRDGIAFSIINPTLLTLPSGAGNLMIVIFNRLIRWSFCRLTETVILVMFSSKLFSILSVTAW